MISSEDTECEHNQNDNQGSQNEKESMKTDVQVSMMRNRIDSLLTSLMKVSPSDDKKHFLLMEDRKWVTDKYGDQGQYKGEICNDDGLPHGFGDMIYLDGRKYIGSWKLGMWHGKGKAVFENGDVYEGNYDNDQRHGHGQYTWNDGRKYVGMFQKGKRHGEGTFTWPDNSSYIGAYESGERSGFGVYTFPDGSVYRGSWKHSKMHGFGECTWIDGRTYSGEWKDGSAHGIGKEVRPDGTIRHDGLWEKDKPIQTILDVSKEPHVVDESSTSIDESEDFE